MNWPLTFGILLLFSFYICQQSSVAHTSKNAGGSGTQMDTITSASWPAWAAGHCALACRCNAWHNLALYGNCHIKKKAVIGIY